MVSTIRVDGTPHWVGKAQSLSDGRWPNRALGAAQIRDKTSLQIFYGRTLAPLGNSLWVDAQFLAQLHERSLRSLYC